jgi:hypothetical protein
MEFCRVFSDAAIASSSRPQLLGGIRVFASARTPLAGAGFAAFIRTDDYGSTQKPPGSGSSDVVL